MAWEAIVEGYFSLYNRVLFDDFLAELVSAQSALIALGAPFIDSRSLALFIHCMRVAVFLNIGRYKRGFVAPTGTGPLLLDIANIHNRVPKVLKDLRQSYGFNALMISAARSIRLFSDFVAELGGIKLMVELAKLCYFVIALELIFGDGHEIQKRVGERVSLITFHQLNLTFDQQRSWIEGIYNLRSRYVHEGADITDEQR